MAERGTVSARERREATDRFLASPRPITELGPDWLMCHCSGQSEPHQAHLDELEDFNREYQNPPTVSRARPLPRPRNPVVPAGQGPRQQRQQVPQPVQQRRTRTRPVSPGRKK